MATAYSKACQYCGANFSFTALIDRKYCGQPCARKAIGASQRVLLKDRFWQKVDRRNKSECWEWLASKSARGYGRIFGDEGKCLQAHRVAFVLSGGEISADLVVRHKCDNPSCCNPSHLEAGTQHENIMDMVYRGRHWNTLISLKQAELIREDYLAGMPPKELAERYGVRTTTIRALLAKGRSSGVAIVPRDVRCALELKHRSDAQIGEKGSSAKLNERQVIAIRAKRNNFGVTMPQLALEYGVSKGAIQGILNGTNWKHLL